MVYGSIWVHMGPYGPIWRPGGEKNDLQKVQKYHNVTRFFQGLCRGDRASKSTNFGAIWRHFSDVFCGVGVGVLFVRRFAADSRESKLDYEAMCPFYDNTCILLQDLYPMTQLASYDKTCILRQDLHPMTTCIL